jgi:hypothetical protein
VHVAATAWARTPGRVKRYPVAATCTEDPSKRSQVKAATGDAVAGGAKAAPAARAPSVTRAEDHSQARARESTTSAPARGAGRDHNEVEEEQAHDGERKERDDRPGGPPPCRGTARSGKL